MRTSTYNSQNANHLTTEIVTIFIYLFPQYLCRCVVKRTTSLYGMQILKFSRQNQDILQGLCHLDCYSTVVQLSLVLLGSNISLLYLNSGASLGKPWTSYSQYPQQSPASHLRIPLCHRAIYIWTCHFAAGYLLPPTEWQYMPIASMFSP